MKLKRQAYTDNQGNQLRRDLNQIVAKGKNWKIPFFWAPVIRYVSCPILAIILSFAYPSFYAKRFDPLHIFAFAVAHVIAVIVILGFVVPGAFDIFIAPERRDRDNTVYAPQVLMRMGVQEAESAESGLVQEEEEPKKGGK